MQKANVVKRVLLLVLSLSLAVVFLITCSKSTSNTPVYPTNCATLLAGAYSGSDICASSGPSSYAATIISNTPGNITFSNIYGSQVTATIDCANNTINIPTQTFPGNFSISGSGTYTANRVIINWTGSYPGSQLNCSTIYTR